MQATVSATAIKLPCVFLSHFILESISTMDLVHGLRNLEFNLMTPKVTARLQPTFLRN